MWVAEVSPFTPDEVIDMPLDAFDELRESCERRHAQETLDQFMLIRIGMNGDEKITKKFLDPLEKTLGVLPEDKPESNWKAFAAAMGVSIQKG